MEGPVPEQFRPRACHVVKWSNFNGYGFNLHAEKGKAGQFIGKIDEGSPAEAAGLRDGDRIVEVNNVNIGNENHQQVVARIKSGGEETTLLVVSSEADNWYKEEKRVIKGDRVDEVLFISSKRDDDSIEPDNEKIHEAPASYQDEVEPVHEPVIASALSDQVESSNHNGTDDDDDQYIPRLCHLKKWPHFQGYGFNLHAEKDKPGQFIGEIDDDSPASTAGLRANDRIIEVNGQNVEEESHSDVISIIKMVPDETKLLVVDRETDLHYRNKGVKVFSSMPQVLYVASSEPSVTADVETVPEELSQSLEAAEERLEEESIEPPAPLEDHFTTIQVSEPEQIDNDEDNNDELNDIINEYDQVNEATFDLPPPPPVEEEVVTETAEEVVNGSDKVEEPVVTTAPEPEPEYTLAADPPTPAADPTPAPPPPSGDGLELNLSVAEMKERLKAKKRNDPRLNKISFEQKFKEFQRM